MPCSFCVSFKHVARPSAAYTLRTRKSNLQPMRLPEDVDRHRSVHGQWCDISRTLLCCRMNDAAHLFFHRKDPRRTRLDHRNARSEQVRPSQSTMLRRDWTQAGSMYGRCRNEVLDLLMGVLQTSKG